MKQDIRYSSKNAWKARNNLDEDRLAAMAIFGMTNLPITMSLLDIKRGACSVGRPVMSFHKTKKKHIYYLICNGCSRVARAEHIRFVSFGVHLGVCV